MTIAPYYLTELIVVDQVHDCNLRSTNSGRIPYHCVEDYNSI